MKRIIALAVMGFAFTFSAAAFAETSQERMSRCSKEAKGLKGDEYKNTRNKCLKEGAAAAKKEAPPAANNEEAHAAQKETSQQRMARCSKEAKGLKGDEYKKTKNNCLKNNS